MEMKYNPNNYGKYLGEYMNNAYDAYMKNDKLRFAVACNKISIEAKTLWKDGVISKDHADEINEYFWGLM